MEDWASKMGDTNGVSHPFPWNKLSSVKILSSHSLEVV